MKRWRVALTTRTGSKRRDEEHEVVDLAYVGNILASSPDEWSTAYLVITELIPKAETPARVGEAA